MRQKYQIRRILRKLTGVNNQQRKKAKLISMLAITGMLLMPNNLAESSIVEIDKDEVKVDQRFILLQQDYINYELMVIQHSKFVTKKADYIMSKNDLIDEVSARRIVFAIENEVSKYPEIDFDVIMAQIEQESNFNPYLVGTHEDSGLMQILPDTGAWIARKMELDRYNLFNIENNIAMGVWYLNEQMKQAKSYTDDADEQLRLALVAYNAGPRAFTDFKNGEYRNNYHEHVLRRIV